MSQPIARQNVRWFLVLREINWHDVSGACFSISFACACHLNCRLFFFWSQDIGLFCMTFALVAMNTIPNRFTKYGTMPMVCEQTKKARANDKLGWCVLVCLQCTTIQRIVETSAIFINWRHHTRSSCISRVFDMH